MSNSEAPPPTEQATVIAVFTKMLESVTRDGGRKRVAGTKPPWWRDGSHMPAVFSHFRKRAQGELRDPDSGAHPYVHAAWRLLAIAYQETHGQVDPDNNADICVFCREDIRGESHYGAGDGTGNRYACVPCWESRAAFRNQIKDALGE